VGDYYRIHNAPCHLWDSLTIKTRSDTPSGEVITQDRKIQVPFSFYPQGLLWGYNVKEDFLNSLRQLGTGLVTQADLAYGLTQYGDRKEWELDQAYLWENKKIFPVFGLVSSDFQQ